MGGEVDVGQPLRVANDTAPGLTSQVSGLLLPEYATDLLHFGGEGSLHVGSHDEVQPLRLGVVSSLQRRAEKRLGQLRDLTNVLLSRAEILSGLGR